MGTVRYSTDDVKEELEHVDIFSNYLGLYNDKYINLIGFVDAEFVKDKNKAYIDFIKKHSIIDDREKTYPLRAENIKRTYTDIYVLSRKNMEDIYDSFKLGTASQYAILGMIYYIDNFLENNEEGNLLFIDYGNKARVYEEENGVFNIAEGNIKTAKVLNIKNNVINFYYVDIKKSERNKKSD